jgi:hypothetical protein
MLDERFDDRLISEVRAIGRRLGERARQRTRQTDWAGNRLHAVARRVADMTLGGKSAPVRLRDAITPRSTARLAPGGGAGSRVGGQNTLSGRLGSRFTRRLLAQP